MSVGARLTLRTLLVLPLVAAMMFAPAGSFHFWQGWLFLATFVVFNAVFVGYFHRRDPGLLERRMKNREPRREQKKFRLLWVPLWIALLALPGYDYRVGWSTALLGAMPVRLTLAAVALIGVAWALVFQVMRINSFASAIIQVEAGQKLITHGPYRVVRHPMYSGFILMILATPFALGSYISVAPAVLLVPTLVFRLRDEESVLRKELPGYAEYCERTRYRLIPSLF